MERKCVVAFDFGPGARAALRQALALRGELEIVLLHSLDEDLSVGTRSAIEDALGDELAIVREMGHRASLRLVTGPKARALAAGIRAEKPDLVFIGMQPHPRGKPGALARALVRMVDAPIVGVPGNAVLSHRDSPGIVAAIDFDAPEERVFAEAARLAVRLSGSVRLVHAVPETRDGAAAAEKLAALADRLRAVGIPATSFVECGDPASVILAAAHADPATFIVIGTRDRGVVARTTFGSVADSVLARAAGPVLVAREEHATQAHAAYFES